MLLTEEIRRKNVLRYLEQREQTLRQIHPQWDFTKQQSSNSTTRSERTGSPPICIPPSWDLIKKYVGAVDRIADGYNPDFYNCGLQYCRAGHGEAAVLDMIRTSNIGGVLIGNIDSRHMLKEISISDTVSHDYLLPKELREVVEGALRQHVPLSCSIRQSVENEEFKRHFFEIDFVFIHPTFGLYLIEVKKANRPARIKDLARLGFSQVARSIEILKTLFVKFCNLLYIEENPDLLWKSFSSKDGLILLTAGHHTPEKYRTQIDQLDNLKKRYSQIDFYENNFIELHSKVNSTIRSENFFSHHAYKYFTVFLSSFRPDCYISPELCALQTYHNIVTHKISALRLYDTEANYDRAMAMRFDISAQRSIAKFATQQKEIREKMVQENVLGDISEFYKIIHSTKIPINESASDFVRSLHQKTNEQISVNSQLWQTVDSQLARITETIFSPDNTDLMMQWLKKDVCGGLINSLEVDAHSSGSYLFRLQQQGLIRHSDLVFLDGRREIYFTRNQLHAVDVFHDNGSLKNQTQIITGAPGTSKSLIMMMKLFILKQIRPHKKLAFASWFKHDYVVKEFLKRNACNCCRKVKFFSEHHRRLTKCLLGKDRPTVKFDGPSYEEVDDRLFNETRKLSEILESHEYDVVLDERHVKNNLDRFKKCGNILKDVVSIAVVTDGYKLISDSTCYIKTRSKDAAFDDENPRSCSAWMEEKGLIEPCRLSTVFRSTNQIQHYVSSLLKDQDSISGHTFQGIPVEEYHFDTEQMACKALASRISKLNKLLRSFPPKPQIALIAENPRHFQTFSAFAACLQHVEVLLRADEVPSLEFPIVITICSNKSAPLFLPIAASRAICHLIVFKYEHSRREKHRPCTAFLNYIGSV